MKTPLVTALREKLRTLATDTKLWMDDLTAAKSLLKKLRNIWQNDASKTIESAPLQQDAQFITRQFSNEFGTRDYQLYIPSGDRHQPCPLLIMLHGCMQTADDFALGTDMNALAEEFGLLVAYPHQTPIANPKRCWNWYKRQHQQAGQGEPSIIAGITQAIIKDYPVDTKRVYVAGLSAGAGMAAILGAVYPKVYAAVGVHSGAAVGSANNVISALATMYRGSYRLNLVPLSFTSFVPTIIFQGDSDPIVNLRNGAQVFAQAEQRLKASSAAYFKGKPFQSEQLQVKPDQDRRYTRSCVKDNEGTRYIEYWLIHGAGHAWSGGNKAGSYSDPEGPNASREMVRFFLEHTQR